MVRAIPANGSVPDAASLLHTADFAPGRSGVADVDRRITFDEYHDYGADRGDECAGTFSQGALQWRASPSFPQA